MSMKNGRGRGRMSKNRYPPFRPSEEIVDFWARLEPANFRATIENYVGNPPKGFKIKEARKLADLGKNSLLRDFLEKQYPRGGSSPVDWQPPAPESTSEAERLAFLQQHQKREATHLEQLFPEEKMSYQGARPLQEIPNGTAQNSDKRANSIADITKTLGNIIEDSKPNFSAILMDIKNDNGIALYEHLSKGLDVNTILPAVPRKKKERNRSETRPLTLLECAISETAFNCVMVLISNAKLDLNHRATKDCPSPAARAFSGYSPQNFAIGKMIFEKNPNINGKGNCSLLNTVFYQRIESERASIGLFEVISYLLGKGCRFSTQKEIWKIYEKFELLSKKSDCIDSFISIIDAHRAQISDEIKSGECCSTIKLLDEYKKMDNPEQKNNIFRIISAILVADRRNSYDNFFAVANEDLVEFLPSLKEVLLSDDCPLTADSLTGLFRSLVKGFRHPGCCPKVTSEKRKFAEALLDSGKLNLSLATRADNKNIFILNYAMRMREGDFDEFFEKIVQRGLKDDANFVNTPVRDENWLSGSIKIMSKHYSLSDIEAERLEYLIKNGYDLDRHKNPFTFDLPVHFLGAHGSTNTFHLLGEERLKTKNKKGWTAAHFACDMCLTRSAAHLFRAFPSLMDIENADGKKPMDLVKAPHNVAIIKKMINDGVPETQLKYDQLVNPIKIAMYLETSASKNVTNAVEDFLNKTKEEAPQAAMPRSSISFAPTFPALDKAEIDVLVKKAANEKGDSAEIATAEKTEELAEKEQKKDSEPDEPVHEASLRKTAEDLCSRIIKDVVDDIFASETQDLREKEAAELEEHPEKEILADPVVEEKHEESSAPEKEDLTARQSTRSPDIKELYSFDNSEEAALSQEVEKIFSEQSEMLVDKIKTPIYRRKPKVPRIDSGCESPRIPSAVISDCESEDESVLSDEETVKCLCNDATVVDQKIELGKKDEEGDKVVPVELSVVAEPTNDQVDVLNTSSKVNNPKEQDSEKLAEVTRVVENMQSCESSAYASSIAGSYRSSSHSIAATTSTISAQASQTPSYMERIYKMEIKNLKSDRLELAQENDELRTELEKSRLELEKYINHFGRLPDTL